MKPIIFARITSMKYYRGITKEDKPYGGGSYVTDTGMAHECYNFKPEEGILDEEECCLGFVMLNGTAGLNSEVHLEKMNGCEVMENEASIDGVTVVFCATSLGSKNMRVVGFYKNATVYRKMQELEFETLESDAPYFQDYIFMAKKEDCVLLPYMERHSNSKWYVPTKGRQGAKIGFGRSNIWYANDANNNPELKAYIEKMLHSVEEYDGENWMDKEVM